MSELWHPLGSVDPQDLTETRLQLHYAIQPIAAAAAALIPPVADGSSASLSLGTIDNTFVFLCSEIPGPQRFRLGLNPVNFNLVLADPLLKPLASFELIGKTLEEGLTWVQAQAAARGIDSPQITLLSYPDDFPQHPIAQGQPFNPPPIPYLQELTHSFANTQTLLRRIAATTAGASPIHLWPHHFDLATLITLAAGNEAEAQTVGVGHSPGDQSYPEPYWYVTPWPYPPAETTLPPLSGDGFWHRQGFIGAILTGSRLVSGDSQVEQVKQFLDSAIAACRSLLEAN